MYEWRPDRRSAFQVFLKCEKEIFALPQRGMKRGGLFVAIQFNIGKQKRRKQKGTF
jgi:hypothetical protein